MTKTPSSKQIFQTWLTIAPVFVYSRVFWGIIDEKTSIIRFEPNPEQYDEFSRTPREFLDKRTREGVEHTYVMTKGGEVFSVSIRDSECLQQSAKEGVEWLNG